MIAGPLGRAVLRRSAKAKTYADFVAYVNALPGYSPISWTAPYSPGSYRGTMGAFTTGNLFGSPWAPSSVAGAPYADSVGEYLATTVSRFVQHCLPSPAEVTNQTSGGFVFAMRVRNRGSIDTTYPSVSRNGFPSTSFSGPSFACDCDWFLYWDGTRAQLVDPSTGAGPTPFAIP